MADKYELPPYVLSRVRYYDGEYLKDDEFIDEQKYHIDRKQRHDRLLHVAGVCEGLVPSRVNATTIKVSAGSAIDDQGHTILMGSDQTITVKPEHNGALFVQILFKEVEDRPADANSAVASNTRFTQAPVLRLAAAAEAHAVVLGQASISNGNASQVTATGRVYSGLRLPGPGNAGYVLHARGDTVPGLVDLECSLNVTGKLQVSGNIEYNQLSKLDVIDNYTATVGCADFKIGHSSRRGSPGRALVDAKTALVLNYGGDWAEAQVQSDLTVTGGLKVSKDTTILGNSSFGSSVRQMLNLYSNNYGIGVQGSTLYFRTNKNVAFYKGGAHNDSELDGGGGTAMLTISNGSVGIGTTAPKNKLHVVGDMVLGLDENNKKFLFHSRTNGSGDFLQITHDDANGNWVWGDGITLRRDGKVGIGTPNPQKTLDVDGNAFVKSGLVANGINIGTNGAQTTYTYAYESLGTDSPNHNLRLFSRRVVSVHAPLGFAVSKTEGGNGNASIEGALSFGSSVRQMINLWDNNYGIGVQSYTLYFRTDKNIAFYKGGAHNDNELNGGGGSAMMTISNGNVKISGKIGTSGYAPDSGYPSGWGGGIHTWDIAVRGTGRSVHGWQSGGWDLAEKFDEHEQDLTPGDVVVADPEVPEKLVRSSAPQQQTILGVISEKPGFLLGVSWEDPQNPIALALAGRVPVKVTLEGGPIRIGDYLTSASEPGHAMKANRPGRVLGMALSAFDGSAAEKGKVIVMVNPHDWAGR